MIPARAVVKISLRLVPDQRPEEVVEQLEPRSPRLPSRRDRDFKLLHASAPCLVDPEHPLIRKAAEAMQKVFGQETVYVRCGGSIPIVGLFQQALGIPIRSLTRQHAQGATYCSWDGNSWHEVDRNLDGLFPPEGPARYRYYLKCELSGDAHLRRLGILNDLQMAPLTLPGMGVGTNAFTYTDETREQTPGANHPPVGRAVREPTARRAGRTGLSSLRRSDRRDRDRLPVAARQRSRWRRDRRLPLRALRTRRHEVAPLHELRQAHLSDSRRGPGSLHAAGPRPPESRHGVFLARPARDDKGVWGPWSPTWSFTPRGPAPPRDVRLEFDRERNRGVLRWAPNPLGRKPVAYRVYASDEKGFSVSDRPYKVTVGVSEKMPSEFPANFVVETSATELEVVGPHVKLQGANKAFYRVVAVDAAGNRSGPSDYAASPRPVIVSAPVTAARKGVDYRYPVAAIRSLGDLRTRVVNGKETMNFWDVERLRFDIQRGPRWLTIDEATGLLSGTPDRSGTTEVVVSVTLERDVRRLDEEALKWGIEKVISSGTETVGSATQSFVIEVGP